MDRVIVDTSMGELLKDDAKVQKRIRVRKVSDSLKEIIEDSDSYKHYIETGEDGPLVTMYHGTVYRHWKKIVNDMGYDITFHDLRHLAASAMVIVGVPKYYSMDFGGWTTPDTMEERYIEVLSAERQHYEDRINEYFDEKYPKSDPARAVNPWNY